MTVKLINDVEELTYGSGQWHQLIGDIDNISTNGRNLTIVVLSYNRSSATIKLIKSISSCIPEFEGALLIIDNASSKKELNNIKRATKNLTFKFEIVELEKNYGVAGGRNKAIEYIKTDWFLNLDNDIYFINNPLKVIQSTIAKIGCKFLNLPLISNDGEHVFANGGHLYVQYISGNIHIGGGSLYAQNDIINNYEPIPSLSTFLFGGASVINKKVFEDCGKFDDNMFIGFEDIDFSITVFKKGYKVGNCPTFSLVHDHELAADSNSIEYEKERFSSSILMKSAKYFEKKHGLKVWSETVEKWLNEKHESMCTDDKIIIKKKPKIALVVDTENWAFANIATIIMKELSEKYEFKLIVMEHIDNIIKILLMTNEYDLVHFFWRGHLLWLYDNATYEYAESIGVKNSDIFIDQIQRNTNISTSVYDHLFLDDNNDKIFNYVRNYYVSSNRLEKIYKNFENIKKPFGVITDGVDLNKFYPINLNKFEDMSSKKIIIGWVGNSKWSGDIEDFKGVNTILKPTIEELIKEGYPLEMYFADKNERMIPHDQMNEYYSKIDLYICTSKIEGTPNPILEAMACGIPIITTDVGIVPEAFGKLQKQMILKERNIKCLKEKIKHLINNIDLFKELSNENLTSIQKWSWHEKVKDFDKYFDECIKIKR